MTSPGRMPLLRLAGTARLKKIARNALRALLSKLDDQEDDHLDKLAAERMQMLMLAEQMAGVGTWSWDVETDETIWSDEVYRIHGFEPGAAPPDLQGVLDCYHPKDAEALSEYVRLAVLEGRDYAINARIYQQPDGSERYVVARGSCVRDSDGTVIKLIGTFQDVTEHGKSEQFIRGLTDHLPGMVAYWDRELRCRFANAAYADWFGRSPESMLAVTLPELLGPELFAQNEPYVRAALNGEKQVFARTLVKPNGEIGHTWAHYIPDLDADGRACGMHVSKRRHRSR